MLLKASRFISSSVLQYIITCRNFSNVQDLCTRLWIEMPSFLQDMFSHRRNRGSRNILANYWSHLSLQWPDYLFFSSTNFCTTSSSKNCKNVIFTFLLIDVSGPSKSKTRAYLGSSHVYYGNTMSPDEREPSFHKCLHFLPIQMAWKLTASFI